MSRADKALWTAFFVVWIGIIVLCLTSCGNGLSQAQRVQAVSCLDIANAALQEARSCEQARASLAKALDNTPQCAAIFGLHLNLVADGGTLPCDD